MNSFKKDLSDSAYDFQRVVIPVIKQQGMLEGELISIEAMTASVYETVTKQFDILAGVDIWQIVTGLGIRGMASRIQWGDKAWDTFTIRESRSSGAETEYTKRLKAIESKEWLYPYYTLQAYITKRRTGHLLSLAVAKTEDIFMCVKLGLCKKRTNPADGNTFLFVTWQDMKNRQYDIKIYEHGGQK